MKIIFSQVNTSRTFPDVQDAGGRVSTRIGLALTVPDRFRNGLAKVTCLAEVRGHQIASPTETIYMRVTGAANAVDECKGGFC